MSKGVLRIEDLKVEVNFRSNNDSCSLSPQRSAALHMHAHHHAMHAAGYALQDYFRRHLLTS